MVRVEGAGMMNWLKVTESQYLILQWIAELDYLYKPDYPFADELKELNKNGLIVLTVGDGWSPQASITHKGRYYLEMRPTNPTETA